VKVGIRLFPELTLIPETLAGMFVTVQLIEAPGV
jgi:hypothetical protein